MSRKHNYLISITLIISIMTGCSESEQTVNWYLSHKIERDAKLKWCNDDTARAMNTDCLNAIKAKELSLISGQSAVNASQSNSAIKQTNSASTPTEPPSKQSSKAAADTFHFKPDPKLFPNTGKNNESK